MDAVKILDKAGEELIKLKTIMERRSPKVVTVLVAV